VNILFLCTGNLCRSPTAQYLLVAHLRTLEVDAVVASAGFRRDGQPSPALAQEVLAARRLDLSAHRSHHVQADDLAWADLVLGMAREHVREAVVLHPAAWPHTFTLREIVRRGAQVGTRREHEMIEEWIAAVHRGRRTADLLGSDDADDIADPMGGTREEFQAVADVIDGQLRALGRLLWPAGAGLGRSR